VLDVKKISVLMFQQDKIPHLMLNVAEKYQVAFEKLVDEDSL